MDLLATIAGIALSVALFPQAYRIYRNKSGENISLLAFGLVAIGSFVWIIYGLYLENGPIILSFLARFAAAALVLALVVRYMRRAFVPEEYRGIRRELQTALDRQQFRLYYQPEKSLLSGKIVGLEALLRWQHPRRGLLNPDKFIKAAEATSLDGPIGEWVLREACKQIVHWRNSGTPITIRVNLSGGQFSHPNLPMTVATALSDYGADPGSLCLEITESVLMDDTEGTMFVLKALRAQGVRLSIDDFGIEYSSLSYLKRFPLDNLKIDRSFVRDMDKNPEDLAIVTATISMAQALGLTVTAEGIENAKQLGQLRKLGCDHAQGNYLYAAMPLDQLQKLRELAQLRKVGQATRRKRPVKRR